MNEDRIRVSDVERNDAVDRLGAAFAEGRLEQAEFDERVQEAVAARTRGDLAALLSDLPRPEALPATQTARARMLAWLPACCCLPVGSTAR